MHIFAGILAAPQQHVVEVFNFVDAGTSILLNAQVSADFHAQTVLEAVPRFLQTYGCPHHMTFDRDPRFVGGPTGRDFPSALIRFLLCVGIWPNVCPPHRPDKNAFVERLNRTYNQECLQVFHPQTLEQVREADFDLPGSFQHRAPASRAFLRQSTSSGSFSSPTKLACSSLFG